MKRYGRIALAILEEIASLAERSAALAEAMLTIGPTKFLYPSMEKRFNEIMRENERTKEFGRRRRKFYQTLCRLKKEGIVVKNNLGTLGLTQRGKDILNEKQRRPPRKWLPLGPYFGNLTKETTVIIFDIPEDQREKREWFRAAITDLGFLMIQKSVWAGKVAIPEQLLTDLRLLSLLAYVKFFTVVAYGTLSESP